MLPWMIGFLIMAIITALLDFAGVKTISVKTQILFIAFTILFMVSLIFMLMRRFMKTEEVHKVHRLRLVPKAVGKIYVTNQKDLKSQEEK